MLGSSLLRPAIAKYSLVRYFLLVTQLLIVITAFSVAAECKAATLIHTDLCVSHIGSFGEHEHLHHQSSAVLPFNVGLVAAVLMLIYALTDLLPNSIFLDTIKPPPRFA